MQSITVIIHSESQIFNGYLQIPEGRRLSDFLNSEITFVKLNNVTINTPDGNMEHAEEIYINRDAILMLRTLDGNVARTTANGSKEFPFVKKTQVPAIVRAPNFELIGNLHTRSNAGVSQLLGGTQPFLPCTHVKIHEIAGDTWLDTGFVAVNRKLVSSVQPVM